MKISLECGEKKLTLYSLVHCFYFVQNYEKGLSI